MSIGRALLAFFGCVLFSLVILWGIGLVLARIAIPGDIAQVVIVMVGLLCLLACGYCAYLVFQAFIGGPPAPPP